MSERRAGLMGYLRVFFVSHGVPDQQRPGLVVARKGGAYDIPALLVSG